MREMKDSGIEWIGEIPVDWSMKRVKHIFTRKNEKAMQENPTILSLARDGVKVRDISNNEGQIAESYYNYNPVEEGDLLLNPMDLYSGANCSISKVQGVISPAYINLKANTGVNPDFYDYYFKVQYWLMAFFSYGKGVSYDNRWTLSAEDLMNYPVVDLSYEEQCKRADYLDRKCSQIDAIIARQQEVIEKLKAYKLSVITEAVTKGLNPDVPMKDSGVEWIGEIPDFWNIVPLKTCADILPGYAFSSDDFDIENGTALLRGINVTPNGIRWEDVVYWNNPITEQLRTFELVAGDIVVGLDRPWVSGGTRVCWVTQKDLPALLLQRVCRIRAKENIDSRWIYHWIASKSFQEALSIETTGVSVPHISTKQIGQFSITLPPIEVQHQICDTLEVKCYSVGKVIDKKQAIIDKLTQYKKSLIYEVVTGKKEV